MSIWDILLAVVITCLLLVQSISLFIDAKKRGSFPWFWGLWGLIQFPCPTLFYLLFVRKIYRHWRRNE